MDDGGRDDNNGFAIPFPPKPRNDVPSTSAAAGPSAAAAAAQPPIIIEASSKYYVPGIREKSKFRVLSQQVKIEECRRKGLTTTTTVTLKCFYF
ncbi:hypothetical protein B9Z55_015111 [Caenorhabditis nigoni]|uniref:Uncharacterized protein n=1 Tax=Caenorhabditis nigoni TaxID=1611254 RepID=A0A2G5U8N8_9PELO|nr:hypothetical protein B9Z55_015111 [Caenorhabditis nigoni]